MSTSLRSHSEQSHETGQPEPPAEGPVFSELYERYFPEVYDFVVRTMGETERVSEVVTTAFAQTLLGFRQKRTNAPIDAILFSTARDIALDRLGESSGSADPAIQTFLRERFVAVDADRLLDGEGAAPDGDLAELVWQLLAAHSADEYSLIDLVLRRGIAVESLAAAMDYPVEELRSAVESVQRNVEDWITVALLIHRGSDECQALAAELDRAGPDAPSAELRSVVQAHTGACDACPQTRLKYPSAAESFIALAAVPAPDGLKEAVWLDITDVLGGSSAQTPATAPVAGVRSLLDAPARLWDSSTTRQKATFLAAAALVSAVFIAAVILLAPGGGIGISDPQGFASGTHEIGEPSAENVVGVTWDPNPDAAAYSIDWTQENDTLPDAEPDLDGSATSAESPELDPGEWFFHLRTQGSEGQWTSTVHLGPFIIVAEDEDSDGGVAGTATPTPKPRPSATATPAPEPTAVPTATPAPEPPTIVDPGEPAPDPPPVEPAPDPTPVIVSGPCPANIPFPGPAAPSDAMGPVQTVLQYYLLLNEGRYAEAYDLLTPVLQQSPDFFPFDAWASGFASTTLVSPLSAVLVEQGVDYAVVSVEVVAVDVDGLSGNTEYLIQGAWVLVTDGGPWRLSSADVGVAVC